MEEFDKRFSEGKKNQTLTPQKQRPPVKPKPTVVNNSSDIRFKEDLIQEHNGCKPKILPKPNIPPKPKIAPKPMVSLIQHQSYLGGTEV